MPDFVSSILSLKFEMSLGKAAIIALLGLCIVFVVLAVLVGILTLFKLVFSIKIKNKPDDSAVDTTEMPEDSDDEILAVISAAIAYMDQEETVKAPFRIKSIRKIK